MKNAWVALVLGACIPPSTAFGLDDVQSTYSLAIDPSLSFVQVTRNPNYFNLPSYPPSGGVVVIGSSGQEPSTPSDLTGEYAISGLLALDLLVPSQSTLHNVSLRATDVRVQLIPPPAGPFVFPTEIDGSWQGSAATFTNAGCVFDLSQGLCSSLFPSSYYPSADGTFDGTTLDITGQAGVTSFLTPEYLVKFHVVADVLVTEVPEPSALAFILIANALLIVGFVARLRAV